MSDSCNGFIRIANEFREIFFHDGEGVNIHLDRGPDKGLDLYAPNRYGISVLYKSKTRKTLIT